MSVKSSAEKYVYLDQLSTERLNELLRADIESPGRGDEDVIFQILEVIEKRERANPTGRLVDVDKAWAEFQQHYNTPEGEGLSLYPTGEEDEAPPTGQAHHRGHMRLYPMLRLAGIVAACVIGIFALMLGAQAAGFDVFGAIGRWTEETFHFVSSPDGAARDGEDPAADRGGNSYHARLQASLDHCGITEDLAPTWFPDGFEAGEPVVTETDHGDIINYFFSSVDGKSFNVQIRRYNSSSVLDIYTLEKDATLVDQCISDGKNFYILANVDTTTAAWAEGALMEVILGDISVEEARSIINSIGGNIK